MFKNAKNLAGDEKDPILFKNITTSGSKSLKLFEEIAEDQLLYYWA